LTCGRSITAT